MDTAISCPRCRAKIHWRLSDGRLKCVVCRERYTPHRHQLRVSRSRLNEVIEEFLLGHSTNLILTRIKLSKYKLLKLLLLLRRAMAFDVPPVFRGIVEVDETYLGGKWKNRRKQARKQGAKRGRGTSKQPAFGILCRDGEVWAELVNGVEAKDLHPLIERQVRK